MTPEFPPNSESSKRVSTEDKNIIPVTTSGVSRKRRSLRKQFSETFVGGDAKTASRYMIFDVMLPAIKDMVVEASSQGIEKLIFGDSRRRGSTSPQAGPTGYVNYGRYSHAMNRAMSPSAERSLSRTARAKHNFDEIVMDQRAEAEEVIDRLYDMVSRYEEASVADLYTLVGLNSTHTDHKWGWTDLTGSGVSRVRGGYLLDLPDPEPLD